MPPRFQWIVLLISSCIFYMAFIPIYILILFVLITIDFFAGILIVRFQGRARFNLLLASIISTCLTLAIFKYFYFINNNISSIAHILHLQYPNITLRIILPIGLSFHTFQSLSYVIEVYKGKQEPERHFGIYALYVMFFPQLVAGPIERPQNLLWQFYKHHQFEYDRVMAGLKLMGWGMLKKVVIADRLAVVVNMVYDNPHQHCGMLLIIATIFFAFQIYTDFSGYSDIARGAAQILGFKLMVNFRNPYLSQSVGEFWKRWHISLSSWFKDYVYIPLGGNRVSKTKRYANLLITFIISGLWHGASWNFVIWGFINGLFVCAEVFLDNVTGRFKQIFPAINRFPLFFRCFRVAGTFFLICSAWVFFRASTFGDACYILTHFFNYNPLNIKDLADSFTNKALGLSRLQFFFATISIIVLIAQNIISESFGITKLLVKSPLWSRFILYYILVMTIIVFGYYEKKTPFIYFQF